MIDFRLSKKPLPFFKLRFYRFQRTIYFLAVYIRYGTNKMRKIFKLIYHSAAFEVDDHKTDLVRMKKERHAQYICLEYFRFTGTGCSGNKSMGSVRFIMKVKADHTAFGNTDRCGHGFEYLRFAPVCSKIDIINSNDIKKSKQGNIFNKCSLKRYFFSINRCKKIHYGCCLVVRNRHIMKFRCIICIGCINQRCRIFILDINKVIAVKTYICLFITKVNKCYAKFFCVFSEFRDWVIFKSVFIKQKNNNVFIIFFILFSGGQFFIKIFKQNIFTFAVRNNVSYAKVFIIDMRQHPKPVNLISMLFFTYKEKI